MIFPTNPDKRPELWERFAEKLADGKVSFVLRSSEVMPLQQMSASPDDAKQLLSAFRAADIVRFGADRGMAIGPYFGLRVEGVAAQVVDYAFDTNIQSASNEDIQEGVQSLAMNLLFEEKRITEIFIPLVLSGWSVDEWQAVVNEHGTILRRVG